MIQAGTKVSKADWDRENAEPERALAPVPNSKRQRHHHHPSIKVPAIGAAPSQMGGGAASSRDSLPQPAPRLPLDTDAVIVPRGVLQRMVDNVERVRKACDHAVEISSMARKTFEDESKRVGDTLDELRSLANRGHVV